MAGQAIVTVTHLGVTKLKVIVGCNGNEAQKLAEWLKRRIGTSPDEIFQYAKHIGLGCQYCLVVQTSPAGIYCQQEIDMPQDILCLYKDTFYNPTFNPRWKQGIAAHVVVVEI